ncbi:hypothetical protein [Gloeobacter morelensis]|uniref:Uncharacterized protein n=1 Tax=Gloeobacter morelensis MG652769 TaxID=2781736 RepID=A0ABY3PNS0_9CYAN|nr:hypothetical protein [Gloeobacter morelensis]UFP95336.1 hypothetical protein ISF26_03540 [Gloeobacter morelensis MG652769]
MIHHIDDTTADGQELSSCQATYGVSNLSKPGRVTLPSGDCPIGSLLVVSNVQGEMCSITVLPAQNESLDFNGLKINEIEIQPGIIATFCRRYQRWQATISSR